MNKDFVINVLKYLPINIFFKKLYAGEGSILFMHKVVVKHDNKDRINLMKANEIEVFYLEKMLVYLKKKYDLISLDQINERLKNKSKFKKKFIVITFDDGYKDNLTLAYPMFKKHNIPFTIYIGIKMQTYNYYTTKRNSLAIKLFRTYLNRYIRD